MDLDQVKDINQKLIEKCRHGDRRSQYRLYQLYIHAMYNTCIRMVVNRGDAEDIIQEAFVSAFRNLNNFRGDSTFGAWLKRIVVNKSLNHIKKASPDFVALNPGFDPAYQEDDNTPGVDPEVIQAAIKKLPEGARVVLSLHLVEGYKHREIAEMLNISESTSKSQYLRGKKMLKKMIEEINEK